MVVAPESGKQQLSSTNSGRVATMAVIPPKGAFPKNPKLLDILPGLCWGELTPVNYISNL